MSACGGGGGGSPNPVIGNLAFTTNQSVALNATLTATDPGGKAVTFATTSSPASGTLSGLPGTGAFTYTPNAGFTGNDSFGVTATDASGNASSGTVKITVTVDKPPTATSAVMTSDGTDLGTIALKNAGDPDKDPLTTVITVPPPAPATATVNADGTVKIVGLSGFKGLTYFSYKVTDPSGQSSPEASVYIFIGSPQFRAAFVGDAKGDGSNEVYLTDFATAPVAMTAVTQGTIRLKGFAIANNGATVVYRAQDTNAASNNTLSFVQTASPAKGTQIPLPAGTVPILSPSGQDQFVISDDGQWIAVVAGQGNSNSLYVLNVTKPTVLSQIQPAGMTFATQPKFSLDSKSIFFLATNSTDGLHRSLYFSSLSSPGTTTLISAQSDPATPDEIDAYSVSPDQSRVVVQANRLGREGVYFIDTTHPATEIPISQPLDFGQSILADRGTSVGLPPDQGGSQTLTRVAYTISGASLTHPPGVWVSDVSATAPNPRLLVQNQQVIAMRPDENAVMYTQPSGASTVGEAGIDVAGTQALGGGFSGWYDSTGNIVLLLQNIPFQALGSTSRGNFGSPSTVGTTSLATWYYDTSGFPYGVAVIGQGPSSGAPATQQLQLVSALAPRGLLPLASFSSPAASQLTSRLSRIVSK